MNSSGWNHAKQPVLILWLSILFMLSFQAGAETFPGTLAWSNRVGLGTPVSGVIEQVYASPGDRILRNEKLLQLDLTVIEANLASMKTALKNRTEEYLETKRELERTQELYNRTMLAEHDLQVAKNNLVKARALKEKASASLRHAEYDLKYSILRAPFDALVLERRAQPGQVISSRLQPETLFVVAEANRMLARVLVAESWLQRLVKGKAANVIVGSANYPGKVSAVGLEPVTGSSAKSDYPVDIEFEVKDHLLRAGQQVKVVIE